MCNINAVIIISFNHFETRNLKDVSRLLSKKYIWNIFGASFFYNKRGQNVLLYFLILWFWRFATQITFIARELGHLIRNFAVIGPLTNILTPIGWKMTLESSLQRVNLQCHEKSQGLSECLNQFREDTWFRHVPRDNETWDQFSCSLHCFSSLTDEFRTEKKIIQNSWKYILCKENMQMWKDQHKYVCQMKEWFNGVIISIKHLKV